MMPFPNALVLKMHSFLGRLSGNSRDSAESIAGDELEWRKSFFLCLFFFLSSPEQLTCFGLAKPLSDEI